MVVFLFVFPLFYFTFSSPVAMVSLHVCPYCLYRSSFHRIETNRVKNLSSFVIEINIAELCHCNC